MKRPKQSGHAGGRRATVLACLIILQSLCALFFIGDVISDLRAGMGPYDMHFALEAMASVALVGGVAFMMVELRRLLARMDDMDAGLKVARGQMAEVMDDFFDDWNLTAAERDVALMILKGLDNEAIAQVRTTASGTVRAQTTSIYSKSGTHGRAQFTSLFMEELMSGDFNACPVADGLRSSVANASRG
ncbi:helix-turn-helix transcriptional regulator [Roseovarius arcticus]|uniref:helix-turn-helix transcriptional regulator n=1 Tax=Roseovarius arcticus TaxID=2547404 RepID=UPI001110E2C5|nr:helix-turn-helix transcriptional regulator [Roseovarius arcticus]